MLQDGGGSEFIATTPHILYRVPAEQLLHSGFDMVPYQVPQTPGWAGVIAHRGGPVGG